MMYYTNNKPKQIAHDHIDRVINHATNFLDLKDLLIEIKFKRLGRVAAVVDYDEDDQLVEMEVDTEIWRNEDEFERTIFHELVHVKQILDGRLDNNYPSKWYGVEYNCSYYELPWEREAYALEKEMIKSFKNV